MNLDTLNNKLQYYIENKDLLPNEVLEKFNKNFDINFTYNSTAIEGNTLTLIETKMLLEDNISIGGKKLRDIYDVVNHNKAFEYIQNCISNSDILNENMVKNIHEILMENIMPGGIYRNVDVSITGAKHTPPTPNEMYNQLKFFYADLQTNISTMDVITLSAWTHAEFVKIHPFVDGNGRTSRLIMNYQLMANNLLPICITVENRFDYYSALDVYATTGDISQFANLIYSLEIERLDEINNLIKQYIANK